jgi:hypothetical protein
MATATLYRRESDGGSGALPLEGLADLCSASAVAPRSGFGAKASSSIELTMAAFHAIAAVPLCRSGYFVADMTYNQASISPPVGWLFSSREHQLVWLQQPMRTAGYRGRDPGGPEGPPNRRSYALHEARARRSCS